MVKKDLTEETEATDEATDLANRLFEEEKPAEGAVGSAEPEPLAQAR